MTEQIGKITLDYKHYPGEDFYCDGDIENELLEIVQNNPPSEYPEIIEKRANWPILYHLSPLRENIVEWLPMDSTMKVLEVGSGCGAITGALARKAGSVTCIDLSKKRSYINAYRHKECDNVTIHVGNFKDIEPELPCDYDYILLIGVFEYGQGYMGTDTPYEDFMSILKRHLSDRGRMAIAIENKFGLKYWAGCREDHLGNYFSGIEDYPEGGGVRTFTRGGLEKILEANEINNYSFYYPYPDYKFMTSVYSDAYLPRVGELTTNIRNFDRERLLLFDEKNAFDNVIREGLFPLYSNSYMLIIGEEPEIKYVKYSNDRDRKFAIRTDIRTMEDGTPYVVKLPMTEEAVPHVKRIEEAYQLLCNRYAGSKLEWNRCEEMNDKLFFEFLKGITLEEIFDRLLDEQNEEGFLALFQQYVDAISYHENNEISNFDLIFQNILVDGEKWTGIDYEWTSFERKTSREIAYRAFYCYQLGAEKRRRISEEKIRKILQMTEEEAEKIKAEERNFQRYVTGKREPMGVLRDSIGYPVLSLNEFEKWKERKDVNSRAQIYENKGNGFSEEGSYFMGELSEGQAEITVEADKDILALRVDPCMEPCILALNGVMWNGEPCERLKKKCVSNGKKISKDMYVFATNDPSLTFELSRLERKEKNELTLTFEFSRVSMEIARKF